MNVNYKPMRAASFSWLVLLLSLFSTSYAQDDVFNKIEQCIRTGDAVALSAYFNNNVEITVGKTDQDYAKAQAQFVIRDFFANNPVRSFAIVHKGSSGDTYYAVGTYQSARGNYDTNIFLKRNGGSFLIEQIRFEMDR